MITYDVQVEVRADLVEAFVRYMREKHLPEILATGCFATIAFEQAAPTRFRSRYQAVDQAHLDRYLTDHTARFRADFLAHFPEGCAPSREHWTELQRWPG